ncbi:helix-turn-helix transcriptional regulator [Planomicrobium sp. YIM 101495]|uniref:helix-turn-helix transcriptional regulator n=1 Tax=Planomicrobium sp. YIM 101495 TaxID=2665160 RepID=UPI001E46FA51|nr:helix-turn-helix transcriptional regulator [Planomicrobium sp. YIM 101495]
MINNKLKLFRKERGMSVTELAKRSKLSRITVSNVENGFSNPTIKTISAICEVLGKEPKDIFFTDVVNHGVQKEEVR